MKTRLTRLVAIGSLLGLHLTAIGADRELEKLKEAASQAKAMLEVKESKETKGNRTFHQTVFAMDTETQPYRLIYKSFPGGEAADNPKELNDTCSGYGMQKPNPFWYEHGMIDASVAGHSIATIEGKVKVLQTVGSRVAYDLGFDLAGETIVIRTVALAGRDELFISVQATRDSARFIAAFRGYPCGFKAPFDRWIHLEGSEIQNGGERQSSAWTPLDLDQAPWILFTDHTLNSTGSEAGQLGIVFRKSGIENASVVHLGNYSILASFCAKEDANEMQFILCNFDGMSWTEAGRRLAALAKEADSLWKKAFEGLPAPAL